MSNKDPLDILIYKGDEELPKREYTPERHESHLVILVTKAQLEALNATPMGVSKSQYVRNLIRADQEADGLVWPPDEPTKRPGRRGRK